MRDYSLKLVPFRTLDTLSCHIRKCINDHMYFEYCGLIQPEDEENLINAGMENTQVELWMIDEDGAEYVLCFGVAKNLQIHREGDLCKLTVEAVSGSYYEDLVRHACTDRMQEPYRKQLIPEYDAVRSLAFANGASAFYISGSGPTMIAIVDRSRSEALCAQLAAAYPSWQVHCLSAAEQGGVVEDE